MFAILCLFLQCRVSPSDVIKFLVSKERKRNVVQWHCFLLLPLIVFMIDSLDALEKKRKYKYNIRRVMKENAFDVFYFSSKRRSHKIFLSSVRIYDDFIIAVFLHQNNVKRFYLHREITKRW